MALIRPAFRVHVSSSSSEFMIVGKDAPELDNDEFAQASAAAFVTLLHGHLSGKTYDHFVSFIEEYESITNYADRQDYWRKIARLAEKVNTNAKENL